MVCSEKEKRIGFLQSEKVDPELHLFILLPFSSVCKIIVRAVPSSRIDSLFYFECLLLLPCLQDYRAFTTTEHSIEVFLFAVHFVRENDCYL